MFRIAASAEARWRCSGAKLRTLFHFIKQKRDFFLGTWEKHAPSKITARSKIQQSTLEIRTEHAQSFIRARTNFHSSTHERRRVLTRKRNTQFMFFKQKKSLFRENFRFWCYLTDFMWFKSLFKFRKLQVKFRKLQDFDASSVDSWLFYVVSPFFHNTQGHFPLLNDMWTITLFLQTSKSIKARKKTKNQMYLTS